MAEAVRNHVLAHAGLASEAGDVLSHLALFERPSSLTCEDKLAGAAQRPAVQDRQRLTRDMDCADATRCLSQNNSDETLLKLNGGPLEPTLLGRPKPCAPAERDPVLEPRSAHAS